MVLPGVGHIAFEEMPEICNEAMRDWLSKPLPSEARVTVGPHQEAIPFGNHLSERGAA